MRPPVLAAYSSRAHIVRALFEAICWQTREVLDAMRADMLAAGAGAAGNCHPPLTTSPARATAPAPAGATVAADHTDVSSSSPAAAMPFAADAHADRATSESASMAAVPIPPAVDRRQPVQLTTLRVDGGASANSLLMQLQVTRNLFASLCRASISRSGHGGDLKAGGLEERRGEQRWEGLW
jgi:glycerol kinase